MRVVAYRFTTSGPADVSELEAALDDGRLRAEEVVAILGKTEGNGGRNDFTRELAMRAFEEVFARRLLLPRESVSDRIMFSLSGGTEGVVAPHIVVFARSGATLAEPLPVKRLAIGVGVTRTFRPEEIGRVAQITETARAIRAVVEDLRVESTSDVHLVQMKGAIPPITFEQGEEAARAGKPIRSDMVFSRAASALGAALALGETVEGDLSDDVVCRNFAKYSSVASCSAKPGLLRTEILVLGNSASWDGDLAIQHGVLHDMLDVPSIRGVLDRLGFAPGIPIAEADVPRLVGVFAKSEADPRGVIRGKRHTMLTDDDISDTRVSRCVLSSVLAAVLGETAVYVSTRAEHHGPLGGGTLALVARVPEGAAVP